MITKKIFDGQDMQQARSFNETKCAAGKTYQKNESQARYFSLNPEGQSVLLT
jgi:hypothetical protein